MRLRPILFLLLTAMLLPGCGQRAVFKEYHEFPSYTWERNEDVAFHYTVNDPGKLYDFRVLIRHMSGFAEEELRFVFRIVAPSGSVRSGEHSVAIRKPDGSYRASGMGDLWDLEQDLLTGIRLDEEGEYLFEFNNVMPRPRTVGLMELGLEVRYAEEGEGGQEH